MAMDNTQLFLGIVLMILGVALAITAVFRSLNHRWTWGAYELWLIPLIGVALLLVGRWLVQ